MNENRAEAKQKICTTQSNKMKFDDDDDDENIIVRYTVVRVLLLCFQVQHSAHNLFEQIKIIPLLDTENMCLTRMSEKEIVLCTPKIK